MAGWSRIGHTGTRKWRRSPRSRKRPPRLIPPVKVELPLAPHRRVNDLLGMRTAVGGPVMAETTDRWLDATGRRIFCRVFRPVTDRVDPDAGVFPWRRLGLGQCRYA